MNPYSGLLLCWPCIRGIGHVNYTISPTDTALWREAIRSLAQVTGEHQTVAIRGTVDASDSCCGGGSERALWREIDAKEHRRASRSRFDDHIEEVKPSARYVLRTRQD